MQKYRKKVLVTGAAGFIGKNLCEYLVREGYKVRMMVHKKTLHASSIQAGSEEVKGDLTNLKSLINATRGINTVVNLAARKLDEKDSFSVNVDGVKNLLKACEINSVKKIIHLSSVSAKIPKKGTYAKTKAMADKIVARGSIPYVILRVSLVYSPEPGGIFGSIVRFSRLPIIPVFGDGKWISYPIHIEDLSKTIERAIANNKLKNRLWDVGGKDAVEFNDLIGKIALGLGRKPAIIHIPVRIGLGFSNLLSRFLKNPPFTASNILGSTQNVELDINKFLKNFRLKPISLEDGLKEVLSSEREDAVKEAKVLSGYILSLSKIDLKPDRDLVNNYLKVLGSKKISRKDSLTALVLKFPRLAGPAEIYAKNFYTQSPFLKKLSVMSALLESHPLTAEWLLPKKRSKAGFLAETFFIGIRLVIKLILSFLLIPLLNLYKKNEK